jgi:hypothetical protein
MILTPLKRSAGLSRIALLLLGAVALCCACSPGRADAQEKKQRSGSFDVVGPDGSYGVEGGVGEVPEFAAGRLSEALASNNHAFADERLIGKRLRVHGPVSKIRRKAQSETEAIGSPISPRRPATVKYVLQMAVDRGETVKGAPRYLHFEFQAEDRKALADVVIGQHVTVEGICTQPKCDEVYLKDCKLIKVDEKPAKKEAAEPYEGFKTDQALLRKHLIHKAKDGGKDTRASSPEACLAAKRIFSRVSFLFRTRNEVLRLLGDPATISDYSEPAGKEPASPLVYVFDSGLGGLQYTIAFDKQGTVIRVQVDSRD